MKPEICMFVTSPTTGYKDKKHSLFGQVSKGKFDAKTFLKIFASKKRFVKTLTGSGLVCHLLVSFFWVKKASTLVSFSCQTKG